MKKVLAIGLCGALVLSSCGTSASSGAYVGGQFGHVIGSAIGGIVGGGRGHDVGSLVGTIGGAVAGAAIGAAIDNAQQKEYEQDRNVYRQRNTTSHQSSQRNRRAADHSGFNEQGYGDDRISFDESFDVPDIEIRNARLLEEKEDGVLQRNEECKVVFDIMNNRNVTVYGIKPVVEETTGNKHIHISPNLTVESIAPLQGVRYTATVKADKGLKDGEAVIKIGVAESGKHSVSEGSTFTLPTKKNL